MTNINKTTLREIIDDILLITRNNNISESEDFSRSHIAAWVNHYRRLLWKKHLDELKAREEAGQMLEDLIDGEFIVVKETGPHKLKKVESGDADRNTFTKVTEDTFDNIYCNRWTSILAVHDEAGENIQYINHIRRHYQYWRKYTFGEMTAYYLDDKHIYVQGLQDDDQLQYIYLTVICEVEDDSGEEDAETEDDVQIPTWMVPDIKKFIFQNELAVMLNRPSDDSNNATLASVKPHGPQDDVE